MSTSTVLKTAILTFVFSTINLLMPCSYADTILNPGVQNLVAGFGSTAISQKLMNIAPLQNDVTMATESAQAVYLNPANSLFIGKLTRELLGRNIKLGADKNSDALSFTWDPNANTDPSLGQEPLKSADINGLLEPVIYNEVEKAQASRSIDALSGALLPLNTINLVKMVSSLSGDKNTNLKAKLNEKQTQEYLAALRSYIAAQTVALGNLYQLYAERQAIAPEKINANPALKGVAQILGPQLSPLRLENFMATRRILDQDWNLNLIKENPTTLQREQVQLMAENLAETYQTRMTLERLLATMSVLVLDLNQQIRTQLQLQIQNITNPPPQQ